jgi:hypothetical protein
MDVQAFILDVTNLLKLITVTGKDKEENVNWFMHLLNELRTSTIPAVFQHFFLNGRLLVI